MANPRSSASTNTGAGAGAGDSAVVATDDDVHVEHQQEWSAVTLLVERKWKCVIASHVKRGQNLEAETEAEARALRPGPRPRPGL